jgi:hypothetical protein
MPGALEIDQDRMWQVATDHADEVVRRLRQEPGFDEKVLLQVVRDLTSGGFTADDIIAVYLSRRLRGAL